MLLTRFRDEREFAGSYVQGQRKYTEAIGELFSQLAKNSGHELRIHGVYGLRRIAADWPPAESVLLDLCKDESEPLVFRMEALGSLPRSELLNTANLTLARDLMKDALSAAVGPALGEARGAAMGLLGDIRLDTVTQEQLAEFMMADPE